MRMVAIPCALALSLVGSTALAGKEKADYGVLVGVSPFGGSLNFSYNQNKKNSWNVAVGRGPEVTMGATIDDTEYDVTGSTSWAGVFWNHRPVKKADWFRINAGFATGNISMDIEDKDGNKYAAEYSENPVFYTGVGFGNRPVKGFLIGFDIGMLTTGGTTVYAVENSNPDQLEALNDSWRFGNVLPNFQLTLGYGF